MLAACARHASFVEFGFCRMEAHRTSETALSLGARPCSDVPAVVSNEQPAYACAHTQTRHHALSLGRRRSRRACGVRAPRLAGCSRSLSYERPLRQRDGPFPRCTAVLRHASRGTRVRHRALFLGRRFSTHAYGVCALRRATWSRVVPYESPLRQRDGPLPRCTAVLRRASGGHQRAAGVCFCAHANASRRALSREEAHHARLRRARTMPQLSNSVSLIWKPIAPARRPSPSVHCRAPTCQRRSSTSSRRMLVRTRERVTAHSFSGGGSAR